MHFFSVSINIMSKQLLSVSDPTKAQANAFKYLGPNAVLYQSTDKQKKYMILNPHTNSFVSFGSIFYQDYTKHQDDNRRDKYLKRSANIKGDWQNNPYSPNNLSIHILWA